MYKVESPFNPFLDYEYNDSKEMSYMFMKYHKRATYLPQSL